MAEPEPAPSPRGDTSGTGADTVSGMCSFMTLLLWRYSSVGFTRRLDTESVTHCQVTTGMPRSTACRMTMWPRAAALTVATTTCFGSLTALLAASTRTRRSSTSPPCRVTKSTALSLDRISIVKSPMRTTE